MEPMRFVIEEARHAQWPVAPAEAAAIAETDRRWHTVRFIHAAGGDGGVITVGYRSGGESLRLIFQEVGADHADIEGPEIAGIEVVAGAPVDALRFAPADVESAAVIDPHDI